ncbi:hypothetical protein PISMIDRAFT_616729 [Pisolithus microcarpus 441]|uniref:Uncharacterized protein n=1 Tax=Pisolithus microcarpus 441 TaxID=765257 RepID=A0A0C9ZJ83_9AGAM|nr:hypothetical protein PISMIDRAFT_616729 [Pisolithus microcarpus 441]
MHSLPTLHPISTLRLRVLILISRHYHSCGSFCMEQTGKTTSRNCFHSPDRMTDETNLHNHQEEL